MPKFSHNEPDVVRVPKLNELDRRIVDAAILLSQRVSLLTAVAPSAIEALLVEASTAGVPLILDQDFTITGDVLVDEPVKIIQLPGVTATMATTRTLDNGISAASTFYAAGMFTFLTGSDRSVFEAWGTFVPNRPAETVGGKTVQGSAVLINGAHNITLRGRPTITTAFDGVIVVDSDYFRMEEPWRGEGLTNAVVDIEASDHGYAIASGDSCEEVVDLQYSNEDWDVEVEGTNISQAALEINNNHNIRGKVYAYNCRALEVNEYSSTAGLIRWSARARSWTNNLNHYIKSHLTLDAAHTVAPASSYHNLRRGTNINLDATIDVEGATNVAALLGTGGTDLVGGNIRVKTRSDVACGAILYSMTSPGVYFEHHTDVPMLAGDVAVYTNRSEGSTIKTLHMDGRGAGTNVKVDVRGTDLRIVDAHLATNVATALDLSTCGAGPVRVEPYLEGATADRPTTPTSFLSVGQVFKDTTLGREVYLTSLTNTWSYTEQDLVAGAINTVTAIRGFNAVTGADGANGVNLQGIGTTNEPITVHNASASNLNVWRTGSGVMIEGVNPYVVAAGETPTFRPYAGDWIVV